MLLGLGTLIVWVAYLQLFVIGYLRQRRPNILIGRTGGSTLQARCLLSNMSAEAIYVASIIATLEAGRQRWSCPITDGELPTNGGDDGPEPASRQGPLPSGTSRDIGSFQSFAERVLEGDGAPAGLDQRESWILQLQVVADYASEYLPVGASRRFTICREEQEWHLHPCTVGTDQTRSRSARRKMRQTLRVDM